MNEFDRCIDEWAELVAQRNATIAALEQRINDLETNLFAATATVASLEAKREKAENYCRLEWNGESLPDDPIDGLIMISTERGRQVGALVAKLATVERERDQAREAWQVVMKQ